MTAYDHNRMVGIFLLIHGGLNLLILVPVVLIFFAIGGGMFTMPNTEDQQFAGIALFAVAIIAGLISLVFYLPQILGGWKIYKTKPGARTWGIVGSVLALLSFPLGTAAGVYGLWFLFGEEGKQLYEAGSVAPLAPPPPSGWR